MDTDKELIAIVTGGGRGKRLPGAVKKQYLEFNGMPLIVRTIINFLACEAVDRILVTVPSEDVRMVNEMMDKFFEDDAECIKVIAGGWTRQGSVYKALRTCPPKTGYVLIHDAVRPFVMQDVLEELIKTGKKTGAVIPVTDVKYTIKEVDKTQVIRTPDRNRLAQVNTPQVFDYQLIRSAYEKAQAEKLAFTDDASVLEHYGHTVHTVKDVEFNIKLTTNLDWMIMELMFSLMNDTKAKRKRKK